MNLLLVGLRGCGKTTVARHLSDLLGLEQVDLDEIVLKRFFTQEKTINEVWQKHGETAWRNAETQACREQLEKDNLIIALGGGVPIIPEAAEMIKSAQAQNKAKVIYLHCETRELRRRLSGVVEDITLSRPPLLGDDSLKEITVVAQQRDPVYRKLADIIVDVSLIDAEATANRIAQNFI